ncbi:MAG: divalent metal cation transporter, partial [Desulfococcus multivorans]|nr:divalent metal cation transporter [Desulfococcus multivorans]
MANNSSTAVTQDSKGFLADNILVRFFREVLGPAALIAAGMIGAGAVATRLLAGAWFGFDLLWVALYVIPMVIICNDSASRIGNITGRGMMSMIKTEMHPALAWFIFIPTFILNIGVNISQMSVMMESAFGMFNLQVPAGGAASGVGYGVTIFLTVLTLLVVLFGGFKRVVKTMTWMLLVILVCFIIVALKGLSQFETWLGLLGGLVPKIPADLPIASSDGVRSAFTQLMSIAGQALPASVFLSFGYFTSNANYTAADLKSSLKKNIINFGIIWGLFSVTVVVAGATALHTFYRGTGAPGDLHFSQIERVFDAGKVIAPALPMGIKQIASPIFSIGLFVAGFTTLVSVAMLMTYFTLDILGKNWKYTDENKAYRWVLALWIAVPALLSPFWVLPALIKSILTMAGNLVLTPLAVGILIYF